MITVGYKMPMPKNQAKWYSMQASGGSGEISIYADIGMWGITAKDFKNDLDGLGDITALTVRINSYGGEVFDGFAIYNYLVEHKASKTVIIDGIAASMASVIAMAADKGKIQMPENAYMMIHNPITLVAGDAEYLRKNADLLDGLKENVIKAYQRHAAALTRDELWELMDEETWLNAADAKTYGLSDETIGEVETVEPKTNMGKTIPLNIKTMLFTNSTTGPQKPKAKEVNMITCKHCGKEIAADAKFCSHCSKPTNESPATILSKKEIEDARADSARNEQERISGIISRCQKNGLAPEVSDKLIKENVPLDKAINTILDEIEKKSASTVVTPSPIVIKDQAEKFRAHTTASIGVALNIEKDKTVIADIRKNPGPSDLHGLVRACLAQEGKLTAGEINRLSGQDIASHAIRMAGMGSSDLPAILADTMNREFMGGFEDEPTTFQAVCAETENPNFMTKSMTKLSGFSDIDDLPEGTTFKQGKFSDKKETIALGTSGKMLTLSRNLMVNNDTQAISLFPRAMSGAMRRKMNRDFYDSLTYNTLVGPLTTEDGVAFFDYASHGNLKSSSGVPSVATLGVADKMLMNQPLLKADAAASATYLNRTGSILLTGTSNRMTVLQLLGSPNDPAATNGKLVYNPYASGITPVFDAYLQSKLTTASKEYAWYWFAGPQSFRNWVVAYLSGNRTPTLRSEPSGVGEALGISYDIFFDYKFGFEDYRGVIHNDGA
jgi:ATP-dependent protease ClpP protease subunit